MGGEQTKTRSKKGVVYSKDNDDVVDCLFCRIVRGESPPNPLWYKDDRCAIFIPRGPAARLHLLIVPLQHIQNTDSLTEEHRSLLEHMKKVAITQLRVHAQYLGSAESPLVSLASPPSHYAFDRGHLPTLVPSNENNQEENVTIDSSFVFCFHRPPYNSIDHLHLHAIQKPYRSLWNHFMFAEHFRWHAPLESILDNLPPQKAKL